MRNTMTGFKVRPTEPAIWVVSFSTPYGTSVHSRAHRTRPLVEWMGWCRLPMQALFLKWIYVFLPLQYCCLGADWLRPITWLGFIGCNPLLRRMMFATGSFKPGVYKFNDNGREVYDVFNVWCWQLALSGQVFMNSMTMVERLGPLRAVDCPG